MDFLQNINMVWQKIGIVQRALLIAIVLACVITGALLTKWATTPEMRLLFGDLSQEEAGKIVDKISETGIVYQLRGGGTSIYVPESEVLKLRVSLAKEGLPEGAQEGYKIFDNEKIGVSPLVQGMNYNRAMQDEMAKTIQMVDGIMFARVHIVRPEDSMYISGDKHATASVMLRLRPGWKLSPSSIAAITNIVSGATDGLSPGDVIVADSQGNLLSGTSNNNGLVSNANTFMDYKSRVERELELKVQDMLETILGPNRSSVKISATLDMTSETVQTTKYDKGAASKEITTSTINEKKAITDSDGNEVGGGSIDSDETIETENKLNEVITKKMDVPGKIISLSVAATVDLYKPKPVVAEGEEAPAESTEDEMIMAVDDVKDLIRNAVGPNLLKDPQSGEELLTVINTPFNRPVIAIMDGSDGYEKLTRYIEIARQSSMGVLAICALIVLKILTGGKKKAKAAQVSSEGAGGELGSGMSMGLLPAGAEDDPTMAFRRHIMGALKDNPDQVKQLFGSWLSEDR